MKAEYSPPNTFYSHVKALTDEHEMYQFIGKDGIHFKILTERLNLKYIWWNKEHNVIEIWGNHKYLKKARDCIHSKLKKFEIHQAEIRAKQYLTMFEMDI